MRLQGLCTAPKARRSLTALWLGLALAGSALAQDTVKTGTEVQTQGELGVTTKAELSATEQVQQADTITRRGNQLAERMTRMLDEARRDKDILRANCVNRKLTEVNANVRNIDQRARSLKEAAQAGDNERRSHEYTVLTVLSQKLDMLSQEASQCLGESVFEPGASQVVTTMPTNVFVGTDPTSVPAPPAAVPAVNVPPDMSGMQ